MSYNRFAQRLIKLARTATDEERFAPPTQGMIDPSKRLDNTIQRKMAPKLSTPAPKIPGRNDQVYGDNLADRITAGIGRLRGQR